MRIWFAVFGIFLFSGLLAAAPPVFRCIDAEGGTTFSQVACGANAVILEPGQVQSLGDGLRPSETAWLEARSKRGAPAKTTSKTKARPPSASAVKRQDHRCKRTRQQLDSVRAERRRGYKAGKGIKLRERQQRYETYLDSFCS